MKFRVYLWEHKMTAKDFAKKIGYNPIYIRTIVRGDSKPSERLANLIEKETGGEVKAEDLLNGIF